MTALLEFVKHFRVTGWGWYWIAWFFGGFGIAEGVGLVKNTQDTLSWQFWGLEHIDFAHPFDFAEWTPVHWVLGLVLLAFTVWLGAHLIFGIWH
jgi:hypothetical protein